MPLRASQRQVRADGAHALFNTPPDLADHPVKAVHCAIAIPVWTEAYRPAPRGGLGRTRIGLENGDTIVGDRHPDQARLHGVWGSGEFRGALRRGRRGTWVGDLHRSGGSVALSARPVAPNRHDPTSRLHRSGAQIRTPARRRRRSQGGLVVTVAPKVTPSNSHIIIAVPRAALSLSICSILNPPLRHSARRTLFAPADHRADGCVGGPRN